MRVRILPVHDMPTAKSPTGRLAVQQPDWQDLPLTPEAKAFREALRTPEEKARRERVLASFSQLDFASIEHQMLKRFRGQ